MGLRCLLGHDFGEREVERDRREDGDEVVVAFRTVETCERCGERRLVSENKEIRPRERAEPTQSANARSDAADGTPRPGNARASTADEAAPDRRTSEPRSDVDGVGSIVEAAEGGDDGTVIDGTDESTRTGSADTTGDEPAGEPDERSPVTTDDGAQGTDDDAVILTDDAPEEGADEEPADPPDEASDGAADRPDADPSLDAAEREFDAWPETADEDEGFDASSHDDTDVDVDFGGGLTPTDDDHAAVVDDGPDRGTTAEDSNGTTFVRPESGSAPHDGETEYRCPNCGATEATGASSLRAGDICPECHKGYVAERATGGSGRNA